MVSNSSGRLGPSEADGSGRDDMAGTPGNNNNFVRYTRSDAIAKSLDPSLLLISAAQPALEELCRYFVASQGKVLSLKGKFLKMRHRSSHLSCGRAPMAEKEGLQKKFPAPCWSARGRDRSNWLKPRSETPRSEKRGCFRSVIGNTRLGHPCRRSVEGY